MLPSMSAHGYDTPDLVKDDLTDEAIETLYEIVRRAQSSTDKTSRALFTAYEEVLDEQGLVPSDDAILHRFLFRMQKERRKNEGLMQRFMRVLKESFEIEVDIDEEGEGIEVTTSLDTARNRAKSRLGRYSRRGSFDSFFDGTADKVAGTDHVDLPLRTRRGSQGIVPPAHSDKWNRWQTTSDTELNSFHQARLPIRSRSNGYANHRSAFNQQQSSRKRSASVSSRGSLQIRRFGETGASRAGDDEADDTDYTDPTTSLDLSHIQIPGLNAPIPGNQLKSPEDYQHYVPELYRPSDTRLMNEAETFEQQRLHRVTRDCIQVWRNRTQQRINTSNDLEKLAIAFDRRILLKLSFDQLRDTAGMRRSNRETERFFTRLEKRADKARNLFLLTKAFTHWAKSAEDEVQRTSVARRHILRTRFFNGWREITAVNELKIQNFVLGKFLRQWRARTVTVRENSEFAITLYQENLVHRVYKEWFFKFCAIAAPAWRNDRTRRVLLQKWSEVTKVLRERESWATDRRERTTLKRLLQSWQQRTTTIQSQSAQADDFRQRALLSSALYALQKQAKTAPLIRQMEARVKNRLVRTAFQNWRNASQLSRQARDVNRMRIVRNAYTAWNDRLRMKALADRIDDRVLVECLYRWTLASRVSLFQRVHDRQLKASTFLSWVTKTNQRTNTLELAEENFTQFKRAQLLRMCLRRIEAATAQSKAEEFAVVAEHQQKLKQRIFEKFKEKQEQFQKLKQWSEDARYYVLGKRALKTWNEATQHARRNRRREAYSQVRRTVKMNLVRRTFEIWKNKATHLAAQNQRANDLLEASRLHLTRSFLHRWHDRAITLRQQDVQATNLYNYKLGTRHMHIWSERTQSIQNLQSQAIALRQESTEIAATSALKKLGWRLWNIRRGEENARALFERNFEKHVRAMLRFWLEQTSERLALRPLSPTPTSRSRGQRTGQDDEEEEGGGGVSRDMEEDGEGDEVLSEGGDKTHGFEAWTALEEHTLGFNKGPDLSPLTAGIPPPLSSRPTLLQPNSLRRPPTRPSTYPQLQSALRRPPPVISEYPDLDEDFADPSTFWSGTPMPPPTTVNKPGYLKTPSKRSIVRAKRPELLASPEKRAVSPVGRRLGAMSAPPVQTARGTELRGGQGVTSFERRLQEGGFGHHIATSSTIERGTRRGGRSKGKVGFGYVSEIG